MALEIEKKFLVATDHWRDYAGQPKRLVQGYLPTVIGAAPAAVVGEDPRGVGVLFYQFHKSGSPDVRKAVYIGNDAADIRSTICNDAGVVVAEKHPTLRVRISSSKNVGVLTLKSAGSSDGLARHEFEYEIPLEDAVALLEHYATDRIEKDRYTFPVETHPGLNWEVDVFRGDNDGLVIAEVEFPDTETEIGELDLPIWLGEDVTRHKQFTNVMLSRNPFTKWPSHEQECVRRGAFLNMGIYHRQDAVEQIIASEDKAFLEIAKRFSDMFNTAVAQCRELGYTLKDIKVPDEPGESFVFVIDELGTVSCSALDPDSRLRDVLSVFTYDAVMGRAV